MAALTALSPGWAAVVAGGVPGLVLFLVFLDLGVPLALTIGGLFALFVGTPMAFAGRKSRARSPHFCALTYRERRAVMASVLHGRESLDPALAPAVAEQAGRMLGGERTNRRALVLLSIACALQVLALALGVAAGDSPSGRQVWSLVLSVAIIQFARLREPRRMALARTAQEAAQRAGP
jgi:hypothetical protein